MNYKKTTKAAIVVSLFGLASAVNAQTVLIADNFDGYSSQAEFQAAWPVGAGTSGIWSSDQADSGTHSILNPAGGTHMNFQNVSFGGGDIIPTNANPLVWSYSFYDAPANIADGANALGRDYGQLLGRSQDAVPSLNQLLAVGLWNAAIPKASDGETATIAEVRQFYAVRIAFAPGANWVLLDTGPERSAGWQDFQVVLGSTMAEVFINGQSVYTSAYAASEGSVGFYQARIGSGLSSNAAAAFDNYSLEIIPEPSTYAAIFGGLALLGAFVYRRRLSAKK
jgi:hypothetical protein